MINLNRRSSFIIIIFLLIASFIGFFVAWYDFNLNQVRKNYGKVEISIREGEGRLGIAEDLKKNEIIGNKIIFLIYVSSNQLNLKAGEYEFSKSESIKSIADKLHKGEIKTHRVTIQEGWAISAIKDYLEKRGIFERQDIDQALNKIYSFSFLDRKTGEKNLEGFLFPDTYQLRTRAKPEELIEMMLKNMEKNLTDDIKNGFLNQGLSVKEGVVLASIVETEGQKEVDRKMIAGILLNRLNSDMRLDADATVRYIIGNWNKKITLDDLRIDSPYNTRLHKGLPPGAICNPGAESLKAVAFPTSSDYWYYLSEKNGTIHYSKTLSEHNQKIGIYLNY
jgi:UPF0755 protein